MLGQAQLSSSPDFLGVNMELGRECQVEGGQRKRTVYRRCQCSETDNGKIEGLASFLKGGAFWDSAPIVELVVLEC